MEIFESVLIACIPSIITGIITYLIAHKNFKLEISKLKEQSSLLIEKNKQDFILGLKNLETQTETKEKEFQYQIQLLTKQYESRIKEDQGIKQNDLMMSYVEKIIKSEDPINEINKLNDLSKSIKNINKRRNKYLK